MQRNKIHFNCTNGVEPIQLLLRQGQSSGRWVTRSSRSTKKKRGGGQSSGRLTMAPRHERFHQTRVFLIVRLEGMRSEYGGGSLVPLGGVFLRRCDVVGVDVGEARQNDLQREAQLLAEKRSSKCSLHFSVPKSSTYVAIATKQLQMGKLEEHSRN